MRIIKERIRADEQKTHCQVGTCVNIIFNLSVLVLPQDRVLDLLIHFTARYRKRMSDKHFKKDLQFAGSRTTLLVEDRTSVEFDLS